MDKDYLLRKDTALFNQSEFVGMVEKINNNQNFIQEIENNTNELEEKRKNYKNRKKIYTIISGLLVILLSCNALGFLAFNNIVLAALTFESVVILISSVVDNIKLSKTNSKIKMNALKTIYLNRQNNKLKKNAEMKYVQTIDSVDLCNDYIESKQLIEEKNDILEFFDKMYESNIELFDEYIELSNEDNKKAYFDYFGYFLPNVRVKK